MNMAAVSTTWTPSWSFEQRHRMMMKKIKAKPIKTEPAM
jgi:hypothetical protein